MTSSWTDKADSGASNTFPKQCSALRKGEQVLIKGRPCKIVEMSTSMTGKHGHAKVSAIRATSQVTSRATVRRARLVKDNK